MQRLHTALLFSLRSPPPYQLFQFLTSFTTSPLYQLSPYLTVFLSARTRCSCARATLTPLPSPCTRSVRSNYIRNRFAVLFVMLNS